MTWTSRGSSRRWLRAPLLSGLLALIPLLAAGTPVDEPPFPIRIKIAAPVAVSGDLPEAPHVEPFLAAHPTDPNLLFGAAITYPGAGPGGRLTPRWCRDFARRMAARPGAAFPSLLAESILG